MEICTTTSTWKPLNIPISGLKGHRKPWRESVPNTAIISLPFKLTRTVELTCHVIFFKGCCREDRERLQCSMTVLYIAMDFTWNGSKSHVGFTFV